MRNFLIDFAALLLREDAHCGFSEIGILFETREKARYRYERAKKLIGSDPEMQALGQRIHELLKEMEGIAEVTAAKKSETQRKLRLGRPDQPRVSADLPMQSVIELVCREYDVEPAAVFHTSKARRFALPRQVASYLLLVDFGKGPCEIARKFKQDHSTAYMSCRKISRELERDPELRSHVESIRGNYLP